jgi:hypothetical protein
MKTKMLLENTRPTGDRSHAPAEGVQKNRILSAFRAN